MKYDVAIIGGGLAGLSLSIDLQRRGYKVVVIEKGNYPRHKVCGEYISMESHPYLYTICPALSDIKLPRISNFKITSTGERVFNTTLDLGGFGISRYLLEELLFNEAQKTGVLFMLQTKALDINYDEQQQTYTIKTNGEDVSARLVSNSSGRKSNFETKERTSNANGVNYVGIKYHVRLERDPSLIEIHNFPGGYCGISNIEESKSCLCYLVNSKKLNEVHNSIAELEKTVLYKNKSLQKIFANAEFLFKDPVTISGVNFLIKQPANNNTFFLGDSAGSIAPVTGNGMSMALRSASTLAVGIDRYFSGTITRQQLIDNYGGFWNKEFSVRVKLSRYFQKLSEYPVLTNIAISLFHPFPGLAKSIIRQTHGDPF